MNVDNGEIYRQMEAIMQAQGRGERLAEISQHEADALELLEPVERLAALEVMRKRVGSKLTSATFPLDSDFPALR